MQYLASIPENCELRNLTANGVRSKSMKSRMKVSRVGLIAKEGHGEAKQVAADIAKLLLERGFDVVSFPNLRTKGVEHVQNVKDLKGSRCGSLCHRFR